MVPLSLILAEIIGSSLVIQAAAFSYFQFQPHGTSLLPSPSRHHPPPPISSVSLAAASSATTATADRGQQNNLSVTPFVLASPLTQVVSDIDDTLKSSGGISVAGVTLGGIDVQYDRGDFYPGVFQFMWEISLFSVVVNHRYYDEYRLERGDRENVHRISSTKSTTSTDANVVILSPPKVAVLTARAEELKAALEIKNSSKLAQAFRKTGESSKILPTLDWGIGPVLYGSVNEWIIQSRKGMRKFNNFERLLEQDPSGQIMQYVYVGDTGEMDQEAGETMLREYPEVVQAVFLHVVSSDPPSSFPSSGLYIPPPKLINGRPLVFFRTYVGAAAKATQLGLMEADGLMRVIEEAEMALKTQGVPIGNSKWIDLERDVDEAYRTMDKMC